MLVIITGASKGIGFELVKEFSKNSDNLIIAISRNTLPLVKFIKQSSSLSILPLKADITNPKSQKKINSLVNTLNISIDILVNNAGELLNKPFEKISQIELKGVYDTNVFAPYLLIQQLLPLMNTRRRSHILNIGSMGGFQGSSKFSGLSAYTSSKGALAILTECLAEEFKTKNISFNCLALGAVQTEMLSKAFPGYKAPTSAKNMAKFICEFALKGQEFFNGKIIPVSSSNP